jgi:elongation factor Tu
MTNNKKRIIPWLLAVTLLVASCMLNASHTVEGSISPQCDLKKPFLMAIEDVFTIQNVGTVVTGRVERGRIGKDEVVELVGLKPTKLAFVAGIEKFKKQVDVAVVGDYVGLLLKNVQKQDIERGQVVTTPGTIAPHTKFKAKVCMLSKAEGGRHTPFFTGYSPQFYFRTQEITGIVKLPGSVEMVMPGDKDIELEVELSKPVAIEEGTWSIIREGGRSVGTITVTTIIK